MDNKYDIFFWCITLKIKLKLILLIRRYIHKDTHTNVERKKLVILN